MIALSPSGVSSATIRPSLRTVIRAHRRSASARSWVVRTIVASWVWLISSMKVWTSSLLRGSRPVVGSSSSRSVGLVSRARAMATFCCMPRLICSTGRPTRFSPMPSRPRIEMASRLAVAAVEPVQPGGEQQVLHRAELLEEGGVDADPVDHALDRHLLALDVVAEDLDSTAVEREQPADQADQGRLARAVGAEDPVHVAALEAHRHVGDRGDRLALAADDERLADALDEQGRDRRGRRRSDRSGAGWSSSVVRSGWRSLVDSRLAVVGRGK